MCSTKPFCRFTGTEAMSLAVRVCSLEAGHNPPPPATGSLRLPRVRSTMQRILGLLF